MRKDHPAAKLAALMAVAAGLMLGLAACEPPDMDEDAALDTPAEEGMVTAPAPVTVTATEYQFDTPASIAGGLTEFEFVNAGSHAHGMYLGQLLDGKTLDDLSQLLSSELEALPEWLAFPGGVAGIGPGERATLIVDLAPGQYAMLSFESAPGEEVPDFAKGMLQAFEVTEAAAAQATAPTVDMTVDLADFAFIPGGTFRAGRQMLRLNNTGEQVHEMIAMKLPEGMTATQFLEIMAPPGEGEASETGEATAEEGEAEGEATAEDAAPPAGPTSSGGLGPMDAGASAFLSLDLTPGNYVLLCFIPDPADGLPHFAKGMVQEFSIQ